MIVCQWEPRGANRYRCKNCGREIVSPHPLEKIGERKCVSIMLDEIAREHCAGCDGAKAAMNRRLPGLGDAVAGAIDVVTLGHGAQIGHAIRGGPKMLLEWPHGLGDAVQGTVLLKHLKNYHPEWKIHTAAKRGQHNIFHGLADAVFTLDDHPPHENYELATALDWWDPDTTYADSPATKAERCLREVFRLKPIPELCRYQITPPPAALARVAKYRPAGPFAVIHYQGNTVSENKSLSEHAIAAVLDVLLARGIAPVILDWERPPRSGLVYREGVCWFPHGHPIWGSDPSDSSQTPDAATIAALAGAAVFCLGIDSGPGHIFGSVETPAIVAWVRHHPIQYYCVAPNVLHVVPGDHPFWIWGDPEPGLKFFREHYRHYVGSRDLRIELPEAVAAVLDGRDWDQRWIYSGEFQFEAGHWIRTAWRDNDLGIIHEIHAHDDYRLARLVEEFPRITTVVDVGAHIGAFATAIHARAPAARIVCVEANPRNVDCLARNAGGFAEIVSAAATYDRDVVLLNSIFPGASAGPSDSEVVSAADPRGQLSREPNRHRAEPLAATVTIEEILDARGWATCDLLKLDCEGGEWGILEAIDPACVRLIVGEYHGRDPNRPSRQRLRDLVAKKFPGWELRILSSKLPDYDDGSFWLISPAARQTSPSGNNAQAPS